MSTSSSTLDANSPRSSNNNNVPRSGLNLASPPSRPSTSGNQDLNLSLNASPSSYISVSNVATTGGLQKNEATLDYQTQAELQSHYVQHQHQPPASQQQQQQQQSQYCRLGTGGIIGASTPTSLPPSVSLQERSSIIVPVTTHDVDPFVVTVRSSPNKLGKSSSSSFISKTPSSVNCGSSKTGPRLALYRSNSSLDLLDRENYYHHQRASLGGAKLTSHHVHPHQHLQQLDRHSFQPQSSKAHPNKAETNYTGCFTRRKDFGSHGSIDVLANAGGNNTTDPGASTTGTSPSSSSAAAASSKNERSSSLGNTTTGHFLSLVASTMSRDRRGSFDVHDDTAGAGQSQRDSTGGGGKSSGGGKAGSSSTEPVLRETASPRLRLKFQKLWEHKEKSTVTQSNSTGSMGGGAQADGSNNSGSTSSSGKGNISGGTNKAEAASIFRKLRGGSSTTSRNNGNTKSLPEGVKFDVLSSANHTGSGDVTESQGNEKPVLRHGASLMEERYRRRVFAHFDCQSVSANISYAARLRCLLSKRRNTTTGASAASLGHRPVSTPPSASLNNIAGAPGAQLSLTSSSDNPSLDLVPADDPDLGDGNSNNLILSCPYFRNEIGGEEERLVCLTRFKSTKPASVLRSNYLHLTSSGSNIGHHGGSLDSASMSLGRGATIGNGNRIMNYSSLEGSFHRPHQARGLSILEWSPGTTHWIHGTCPYGKSSSRQTALEAVDLGAAYYRKYFYRQDHENWFGSDEILGPLAISIKRERVESSSGNDITTSHKDNSSSSMVRFVYRLIVRSTELNTLRGAILEESIPGIKPNSNKGGCHAKDVIEFLLPEIQLSCLKLGLQNLGTEDQLLKLDQQILTHRHKVGIMYCKAGQATEEEMYNNEEAGPAFNEFLDLIGQRVRLKGFDKYTGGLDTKDDSTGLYTIYSQYQDCDVIFHVSTLLPFTPNNRQQLMRKRHIGNDIVTIVFQEPGALPFTPKNIRSQFQHVFIVVRAINPCTENACYSVSVSRSKEVPLFGPPIPEGAKFLKNKEFVDFLLAKVINAENATYRSEKFTTMATRTRQEYLKDLVSSYSSNTSIDPRPKFSMLPFGNKKKDMGKPKFNPDAVLRGALSWSVYLDDNSSDTRLDTYLAISTDSIVVIDAVSREPVFAIPCSSILGWNTSMCNTLRIYYHQGECVTLHSKEPGSVGENDDLVEIVSRLEAVTRGCETQEFVLRRNDLGQLGFHVQQDGVVTEVELCGFAAKAGLKQGSRLVEICKVAVATLNQEQMIDFLKTSNPVIIMVVPPLPDGSPRRGCDAKHCIYTLDLEGEYENLNLNGSTDDEPPSLIHHQFKTPNSNSLLQQTVPGNHRKRYEPRSFSPPRSSNSSGYGTGSSSKSFSSASDPHFPPNPHEGETLTSSSSGMSSTDDRWYDLTENLDGTNGSSNNSPPPIPARNVNTTSSIIVSPQPVVGNQLVRPNSGTNISNGNMGNNNSIVSKGSGAGRTATLLNNNHPPFQNGTSVVVVNKHSVNQNNLVVSNSNNNNNATCVNGNGASNANNGIYMSSPTTTAVNPLDKSFVAKRDFFQRNNPHHGSFHTKLSPSRSHDLLHLKSTYGIHHSQLKPFPNNSSSGLEDYGALVASTPNKRFQHRDDGRILYEQVKPGGPMFNNSPLIENTVKGKVTYLTDFPLTHSHSSEYLVGYSAHESPSHKDMNALKNERLAVLKSTYLDKHRERYDRDNESNKSRFSAPADSISGELNRSEDDLSLIANGQPRSASMTGRITTSASPKIANHSVEVKMRQPGNNGTPRQSTNRNSTLQEDLMRLIAPDLIPAVNVDTVVSPATTVIANGPRPSSSGSVPITNGYVNLKARPVSCGGEPGSVAPVYNSPARNALANANITPRNTLVINGHSHLVSHGSNSVCTPRRPVEKEEGKIKTVPFPLLPDSGEVDWSTLVDTATKAFQCCDIDVAGDGSSLSGSNTTTATPPLKLNQSTNSPVHHASVLPLNVSALGATPNGGNGFIGSGSNVSSCSSSSPQSILPWIDDMKPEENGDKSPGAPLESVFNLEARVSQLEAELRKEQQSKHVLAAKVANLQHENKILQEQSTTTQNQFKRFAEWLRNTGIPSEQNQNGSKNSKSVGANERI